MFNELPAQVTINEVGPRDGFQNVQKFIATQDKITMIESLIEDRHHIAVAQPGCGLGLAVELRGEVMIGDQSLVHDLDRDDALQTPVPGAVDGRHASAGQALEHLVASVEDVADQRIGRGVPIQDPPRR